MSLGWWSASWTVSPPTRRGGVVVRQVGGQHVAVGRLADETLLAEMRMLALEAGS